MSVKKATQSPSGEDTYFPKFRVIRRSTGDELDPATTFTLLPNKDPWAKDALSQYCVSCEREAPGLAKALRDAFDIDLQLEQDDKTS